MAVPYVHGKLRAFFPRVPGEQALLIGLYTYIYFFKNGHFGLKLSNSVTESYIFLLEAMYVKQRGVR